MSGGIAEAIQAAETSNSSGFEVVQTAVYADRPRVMRCGMAQDDLHGNSKAEKEVTWPVQKTL